MPYCEQIRGSSLSYEIGRFSIQRPIKGRHGECLMSETASGWVMPLRREGVSLVLSSETTLLPRAERQERERGVGEVNVPRF